MWTDQPHTMRQVYQSILDGEDPWITLGNFTNDFYGNYPDRRIDLMCDPIGESKETVAVSYLDQQRWAIFCAASVEYLAQCYGIPVPQWTQNEVYARLPDPWYVSPLAHRERVRERLKNETPDAFRKRNIYCGNRVYLDKAEEAAKLARLLTA